MKYIKVRDTSKAGVWMQLRRFRQFARMMALGQRPAKIKNCAICYEDGPAEDFTTLGCGHEAMTTCLKQNYELLVESNMLSKMQCPHYGCNYKLTADEIEKILDDKYEQYLHVEQKRKILLDKN